MRSAASPTAPSLRARWLTSIAARSSFALIAVWIALTTWLSTHGPRLLYAVCDMPFLLLCHRIPERVLTLSFGRMPLCSRCAGLWLGLSLGASLARPALSMRALRVVVPGALALLVAELVTQELGLHPIWHTTRLLSGLLVGAPLGGAIGALIVREVKSYEACSW